ncbi:MAG: hypothetical protein ACHQ0J_02010 [Candidatus Dormibacterales bacterium]
MRSRTYLGVVIGFAVFLVGTVLALRALDREPVAESSSIRP